MDKVALRQWAREQATVSDRESRAVVEHLDDWLGVLAPSVVLVYLSMEHEISVEDVVPRSRTRHRFLVTRTPPSGPLTVHRFDAPRERHRLGYEQPVAGAAEVSPTEIDVALVPGLCFDRVGGRLGWGKGYYDHLLARARPDIEAVGITLERMLVAAVPMHAHDVPMTHLATDAGVTPVDPAPDRS